MVKITKSMAKIRLGDVVHEKQFFCQDGRVFRNLRELELALRDMSAETYRHHSNESKNDFSNWVSGVIGDDKLSRDLRRSTNHLQAAKCIADRIAWLENKLTAV